jgi:ribonuclease R
MHVTQLPNDYYHFDPGRRLLRGERRGVSFQLGDPVRIQVLRASIDERKIDFRLLESATGRVDIAASQAPPGAKPAKRKNKR